MVLNIGAGHPGPLLLKKTYSSWGHEQIITSINLMLDAITNPYPNLNSGLANQPLKDD